MYIYQLTKDIAGVVPLTDDYNYFVQIMTSGGLPLLVHYLTKWTTERPDRAQKYKSFNPPAVFSILDHILRRTCVFEKPLEFVKVPEIVQGRIDIGIAPALAKHTAIKTNLNLLEQAGIVIKIKFRNTTTIHALYGLDLLLILRTLHAHWQNDLGEIHNFEVQDLKHLTPKSKFATWLYTLTANVIELMELKYAQDTFERIRNLPNPAPDFDAFLKALRKTIKQGREKRKSGKSR